MLKRFALMIAVLLVASPAFAGVVIECTANGTEVTVSYDNNDLDPKLIRAVALDITVDGGATISSVNDSSVDYWVHPGSIAINDSNGNIDSEGNLVADPCEYDDTLGGVGTAGITIEAGSLYEGDPNAPDSNGVLFSFVVSGDCTVSIAKNTARGGVVMEDPNTDADPHLVGCTVATKCFPSCHPDYAEWVSVGEPNSWCYLRQCHGDTDNNESEYGPPAPFMFPQPKAWVTVEDITVLLAGYKQPYGGNPSVDTWIAADFNHDSNEYGPTAPFMFPQPTARVTVEDINILLTYYKAAVVPTDCLDCP